MKERIGETAGRIWEILRKKQEVNVSQLPRNIKEKSGVTYQALGWLARENKISYYEKGNKTFVSLTDLERNIHLN
ncbi:winged helix-turn-helix domain-containing protein [bacterium]|nr:winged helix-turn-helix domain-containing protein [bacterium]